MTGGTAPRIYLSAGEPSGDLHGAAVVRVLRRNIPGSIVEATGGPLLENAGAVIRHSIARYGALGAVEVIRTVPRHLSLLADLRRRFRSNPYDLLILVDYPGFHLRVARAAAESGIPVLYYIAPQLWAWGLRRAALLQRWIRQLAVILPFEEKFFRGLNLPATFVGHPLLDRPSAPTRVPSRKLMGLPADAPVLGIFPGSRRQEVERLWPAFRDAALLVRRAVPEVSLVVAGMTGLEYPGSEGFIVRRTSSQEVLSAADAGLCKSGTTTLEAVLADLPMVVSYRMNPWTHALARLFVRVGHVGLVNLVAGRSVAPELLQGDATPAALAEAVLPLLDRSGVAASAQRSAFAEIRPQLGTPGAAARVAEMAAQLVA